MGRFHCNIVLIRVARFVTVAPVHNNKSYPMPNNFAPICNKCRSSHQWSSMKKAFLKISQNSQVCIFIKKETPKQVFSCEFCEVFKNILRVTVSVSGPVENESSPVFRNF